MKDKKEQFYSKDEAFNVLNRIDMRIGSCDTKFSITLALLGIFFGLTINVFTTFTNLHNIITLWNETLLFDKIVCIICCALVLIYIVLIILCSVFSIIGINAKIKNKNINLLFFGSVSKYKSYKDFDKDIKNLTEEKYVSLLNEQIYTNSKICTKKFSYYKKALFCLLSAIIVCIICLILLYI